MGPNCLTGSLQPCFHLSSKLLCLGLQLENRAELSFCTIWLAAQLDTISCSLSRQIGKLNWTIQEKNKNKNAISEWVIMLCAARKMYAHKVCAGRDSGRIKRNIPWQRLTVINLNHCEVKINKTFLIAEFLQRARVAPLARLAQQCPIIPQYPIVTKQLEHTCLWRRASASHLDSLVWLCPTRVSGCCPWHTWAWSSPEAGSQPHNETSPWNPACSQNPFECHSSNCRGRSTPPAAWLPINDKQRCYDPVLNAHFKQNVRIQHGRELRGL